MLIIRCPKEHLPRVAGELRHRFPGADITLTESLHLGEIHAQVMSEDSQSRMEGYAVGILRMLRTEPETDKWIGVEERLPPPNEPVLVSTTVTIVSIVSKVFYAWCENGVWRGCPRNNSDITHWQPLPAPHRPPAPEASDDSSPADVCRAGCKFVDRVADRMRQCEELVAHLEERLKPIP